MKTVIYIFRELAGLFIDDGLLALAVSVVVVCAAVVAAVAPIAAGIVLLVGCPGVLFRNVIRAGKWRPKGRLVMDRGQLHDAGALQKCNSPVRFLSGPGS